MSFAGELIEWSWPWQRFLAPANTVKFNESRCRAHCLLQIMTKVYRSHQKNIDTYTHNDKCQKKSIHNQCHLQFRDLHFNPKYKHHELFGFFTHLLNSSAWALSVQRSHAFELWVVFLLLLLLLRIIVPSLYSLLRHISKQKTKPRKMNPASVVDLLCMHI